MRGTRIPTGKRIINNVNFPPVNAADYSEANADHLMFIWDNSDTGEFLEDASILVRHLKQLLAREQISPNLTVYVEPGTAYFRQDSYIVFAGGNSPAIVAPTTNDRIDVLTIRNTGALFVITGVEAVSPVAPTYPATDVPLAQIYCRPGMTTIRDFDTQVGGQGYILADLRPFIVNPVGANAMPKIGIVARTQTNVILGGAGSFDVINFTGAGRLRGLHLSVASAGVTNLQVIIDGTTLLTYVLLAADSKYLNIPATNSSTTLQMVAGTDNPNDNLDLSFKDTLVVKIVTTSATNNTVTVDWEHE